MAARRIDMQAVDMIDKCDCSRTSSTPELYLAPATICKIGWVAQQLQSAVLAASAARSPPGWHRLGLDISEFVTLMLSSSAT
jgi:hypothetical protein